MGRKHCGKRKNARHEKFLLFSQCFQKTCTPDTYKPGLVWERVKTWCGKELNYFDHPLSLSLYSPVWLTGKSVGL